MRICSKCKIRTSEIVCPKCRSMTIEEKSFEVKDPFIGNIINDKYKIESLIGKGGMGSVYKAVHIQTSAPVAVKILPKKMITDLNIKKRFLREAKIASSLRHPNTTRVFVLVKQMMALFIWLWNILRGKFLVRL